MLHVFVALVAGLLMAIFLGQAAAQGSYAKVGMILAIGPMLVLVLGLQHRVWLTVPFFSSFGGSVPFLPVPFAVRELVIILTFGVFVMLAVFKKLEKRGPFDFLDVILFLNLTYLLTVYIRNPVGVNFLGSERVGGRPYFAVIVAAMFYWVYSHISLSPKMAFRLPLIGLAGTFLSFFIWLVSYKVPGAAPLMAKFYTGVDFNILLSGVREGEPMGEEFSRFSYLGNLGASGLMCLISYFVPLTLLSPMYFWRFTAFGIASLSMMMGGFRSKLFSNGIYFLMACYFRGGLQMVVRAAFPVTCAVLLLLGIQGLGVANLPLAMQRSLSALPIPINWDYRVASDAQGSTEWRYEMWRDVLSDDQWIQNKWLGDGFGFSRYELKIMYSDMLGTGGFMEGGSAAQKITGAYHNGPLSAIRFVGVFGLVLYLLLIFGTAFKAIRLIRMTAATPFFPLAMMKIPTIFSPVFFLFVFGGFDSDLPIAIAAVGGVKILSRSFDDYQASLKSSSAAGPQTTSAPAPAFARTAMAGK